MIRFIINIIFIVYISYIHYLVYINIIINKALQKQNQNLIELCIPSSEDDLNEQSF